MDALQRRGLEDEAACWIAHLSNDLVAPESFAKFALWIGQSDTHRQAFDEVVDLWADMGLACDADFVARYGSSV